MFSRPFYYRGLCHKNEHNGDKAEKKRISLRMFGNLARCICRKMNKETLTTSYEPDPAAVFAAATSIWTSCHHYANKSHCDLSEIFNGMDQLMRTAMSVANRFERWSCQHIDFEELTDVWPYLLEDKFGEACLDTIQIEALESFSDRDCLCVAIRMRLPVNLGHGLPVPVDVTAPNPMRNSPFRASRVQTVRTSNEEGDVSAFTWGDDPFDDEFSEPYFGLYGVCDDRTVEHVADRRTYSEIVSLAKKLAPGIDFFTP